MQNRKKVSFEGIDHACQPERHVVQYGIGDEVSAHSCDQGDGAGDAGGVSSGGAKEISLPEASVTGVQPSPAGVTLPERLGSPPVPDGLVGLLSTPGRWSSGAAGYFLEEELVPFHFHAGGRKSWLRWTSMRGGRADNLAEYRIQLMCYR
ncbi:hypothetical protein CYMTET_4066 [Cymbomonas tetramitiformis]|uniref:Uncharacterized protein n=1 Tax=Cymbomonas tetramitiformis TaxID=36881 RepID=A0AAE0LKG4_9CHLO|nr:hypothetical protein CYMTET_4066 [Cymbomonas tetramitiformis]